MSDHRAEGHEGIRMSIEITTRTFDGGVVVAPHGDIDLTTSYLVREVVDQVVDDGARAVVLDLSDVGFMDSTALGVLVTFHRRLGRRLVIAGVQPNVLRLLEITKFTSVLRLVDSVDTALTALRA
jgi:anti-sigma B factor antagonist